MRPGQSVSLRSATAADEPFLYRVYASTREEELAGLDWEDAAKRDFLLMQFAAQERSYREHHPDATFCVVAIGGVAAGRLYVERRHEAIHVIDIALLPEHRGHGVGTRLLSALIEEANRGGKPVTLSVVRSNVALALYRRLRFETVGGGEVYLALEHRGYVNTAS